LGSKIRRPNHSSVYHVEDLGVASALTPLSF
jgi:hypothetical protein